MQTNNLKHVGQIINTQRKCVVVFREVPDEEDSCLIVDTDALQDWMHDDIMNAVESPGAQQSTDFYAYAERTVLTDGTNMLQALHKTGRLQKVPTDTITMTPNNSVSVGFLNSNFLLSFLYFLFFLICLFNSSKYCVFNSSNFFINPCFVFLFFDSFILFCINLILFLI